MQYYSEFRLDGVYLIPNWKDVSISISESIESNVVSNGKFPAPLPIPNIVVSVKFINVPKLEELSVKRMIDMVKKDKDLS